MYKTGVDSRSTSNSFLRSKTATRNIGIGNNRARIPKLKLRKRQQTGEINEEILKEIMDWLSNETTNPLNSSLIV